MKKILLLGLLSLGLLTSCESPATTASTDMYGKYRIEFPDGNNSKYFVIYKVKFKGHYYLAFEGTERRNGVVHDPDCPCHKYESTESDFGF